jgi:hypothetical protein
MTTMAERKVTNTQPLPSKIEQRLDTLVQMGEFDQGDVRHCRASYWGARDDWHKILIDCYAMALERKPRADQPHTNGATR